MTIRIRPYTPADTHAIMQLFHDTVHAINRQDYSQIQVEAWAPATMSYERWHGILTMHHTYVAEDSGVIIGFADFEDDGHLDHFYCHKDYQGRGVGSQLLQAVEQAAQAQGITRFFTEASITAKPFFAQRGFVLVKQQQVAKGDVTFTNYVMHKALPGSDEVNTGDD